MVISGCATASFADGRVTEMKEGDAFYVPPEPHDSWVVGGEPYVSLHFMGATKYAKQALDSEEGSAFDDLFGEDSECSDNRL